MSHIYKKLPKCINCAFYKPSINSVNSNCNRVFLRTLPSIETYHYPNTIAARSYDYLCGYEGKYFADKVKAKYSNFSHIMG